MKMLICLMVILSSLSFAKDEVLEMDFSSSHLVAKVEQVENCLIKIGLHGAKKSVFNDLIEAELPYAICKNIKKNDVIEKVTYEKAQGKKLLSVKKIKISVSNGLKAFKIKQSKILTE